MSIYIEIWTRLRVATTRRGHFWVVARENEFAIFAAPRESGLN